LSVHIKGFKGSGFRVACFVIGFGYIVLVLVLVLVPPPSSSKIFLFALHEPPIFEDEYEVEGRGRL